MSDKFTKGMARNIYYGGSLFFILLFLGLTLDTHRRLPERDNRANLTAEAAAGKMVWEEYNCVGCHTLLGEGAYFAPELGNAYQRFGKSKAALKAFIQSRPAHGIPNRRSMPRFDMTEEQLDNLAEFLKYASQTKTARDWPPNIQG